MRWELVSDAPGFPGMDGAGALVHRGRMWLLGGWNPRDTDSFPPTPLTPKGRCNSRVYSSADGYEWKLEVAEAPWQGRHTAGYAVYDDRMWIVGGDVQQGTYQSDCWSSEDGVDWVCHTDDAPWGPRCLHITVAYDNALWVMGGQTSYEPQTTEPPPGMAAVQECFYRDAWRSTDGVNWSCVADQLPCFPRGMMGGSAVKDGRMWLLGGGTYDTPTRPGRTFSNDVWSSCDGVKWRLHTDSAAWAPRQYHDTCVWVHTTIYPDRVCF